MPGECRIRVRQLASAPPYYQWVAPQFIEVLGHTSRDCTHVSVVVYLGEGGIELFRDDAVGVVLRNLPAGADPDDPNYDGTWTVRFTFDPEQPPYGSIRCGSPLFVEARCVSSGGACDASGTLRVWCKGAGASGQPGDSGGGAADDEGGEDDDGWRWPFPPSIMCGLWKRAYGTALFSALSLIAAMAIWPGTSTYVAAALGIGAAAGALAVWRLWCSPSACEMWGVACWAAKNAVILALPLSLATTSAQGLIAVVVLGGLAAASIAKLDDYRCNVPAAGPWPF
jgi:hypothetical protein